MGNLGGYFGPTITGGFKGSARGYTVGMLILGGAILFGGLVVLCLRHNLALEHHEELAVEGAPINASG